MEGNVVHGIGAMLTKMTWMVAILVQVGIDKGNKLREARIAKIAKRGRMKTKVIVVEGV